MVFIALLGLAASAATAYMSVEKARQQATFDAKTTELNNEAAMANYRRNLEKFAELRVERRRTSLELQSAVGDQYRSARKQFQSAFTDNWGQSAYLYSQQLARRSGEDQEALKQNLGRELAAVDDAQEESRLNLITEFKAPPPDPTSMAIASGIVSVSTQAAKTAYSIAEEAAQDRIRLASSKKQDNIEALLQAIVDAGDFGGLLKDNE